MEKKKFMALSMLLIFVISAFTVFGQGIRTGVNVRTSADADVGPVRADARHNATITAKADVRDRLIRINAQQKAKLESIADAQTGKLENLSDEQLEKLSHLGRARAEAVINSGNTARALAELNIERFGTKAEMFRERVVENFQQVRTRIRSLQEAHAELRAEVADERAEFRAAVQAGNDEDAVEHAKAYLLRVADVIINNLEKMQARVQENDDLAEEEAAEIIAELDAKIEIITEAKAEVEAAETKAEVKQAGSVIIRSWNSMKHDVRNYAGRLVKSKVVDVLKRSEYMGNKLERALTKLEAEGYATAEIEVMLEAYSENVEEARVNLRAAHSLLVEARASDNSEELVEQAKELIDDANEALKDAHEISKEIIEEIRELTGSIDLVVEESAEAYVLVEEEGI